MRDLHLSAERAQHSSQRTMKSMPPQERPYEKCLERGAEALTDAELLSVILRTGSAGEPALELARKILAAEGGGRGSGLLGIYHRSVEELTKIKGVGKVKAVQLKCVAELSRRIARTTVSESVSFRDPDSVARYYMEELRHLEHQPSGVPDPSPEDIFLTRRVREAGTLLGIELLDHIIIGDCQAVSMREQGLWRE